MSIKCKFYKKCNARKEDFTCNNGGGNYCGKYRKYIKNEKKNCICCGKEIHDLSVKCPYCGLWRP